MAGVLFYSSVIGFAVGTLGALLLGVSLYAGLVLLVCSFAYAVLARSMSRRDGALYLILSVALLCGALGIVRVGVSDLHPSAFTERVDTEIVVTGVIVREPDVRESTQQVYMRDAVSGELLLITTDRYQELTYGDTVRVSGELSRPEAFETDLGRTFDYPGYLRARGVTHTVSFAEVERIGHDGANPFIGTLLDIKQQFMTALEATIPEPQAGLGEGLLLGVKRALGADLEDIFRATGIIHIVVLSGYNVMIVAEAIMRLLAVVLSLRARVVVGVLAIGSFALMVGLSATVMRASIMAILVLIARATGRTTAILRALCVAGVIMVLSNPYLLAFDPGFQLSFLATLGLILLAPHLDRTLSFIPSFGQVREFVVATIATQIMVLPLLLYSIGELSVVAVLVNVLVLPMVPIAMGLSFVTGVLYMVVPGVSVAVGFVAHGALSYIIAVATLFGTLPVASFIVPAFPVWCMVLGYGVLGVLLWWLAHRARHATDMRETAETVAEDTLDDWRIESFTAYQRRI